MKPAPTIAEDRIPLAKQYAELLKIHSAGEPNYDNPKGYPTGFFKVVTVNGEPRGFGFFCPRCKINACDLNENSVVRHCGKETRMPAGLFGWLRKLGLRSYTLESRWF